MDIDVLLKSITVLVGVFGVGKVLYEFVIGRKGRMRDEYRFAHEFLSAVEANPDMHPYLKEKGYQAIAGDSTLSADEVKYLLSVVKPDRALKDYVLGRQYLEHLPHAGNLQVAYKHRYRNEWSRRWRLYLYAACYVLFGFAAFSPFVLAAIWPMTLAQWAWATLGCIAIFGPYAWWSVKAAARIYRAKMLVTHQHKHTQRIVIEPSARTRRAGSAETSLDRTRIREDISR